MSTRIDLNQRALIARRTVLVQRLEDGDRRIATARVSGAETGQWEAFWLHLLDEYVDVSRQLDGDVDHLDVAA